MSAGSSFLPKPDWVFLKMIVERRWTPLHANPNAIWSAPIPIQTQVQSWSSSGHADFFAEIPETVMGTC